MEWDGESRCSGGRRRSGFRTRWPLSVTVVAVTGAVNAVTGAVTAVTRGRDPCAGRDWHHAGRDRRGRLSLAQSPGRRPGPCPARHTGVACSRNARLSHRSCDSYARHASLRSPESTPAASLSVASLVTCLARPRGRVFVPNCPKAETAPLPGKGCQAATGARIVSWREPVCSEKIAIFGTLKVLGLNALHYLGFTQRNVLDVRPAFK